MSSRAHCFAVGLLLAGCSSSPGADVNGFPSAAAQAYCRFAYHCCTPADRTAFPPNGSFSALASSLAFDNEGDCNTKLGDRFQTQAQPVQASVKDKRITYDTKTAQACIDALNAAASHCDAQAFEVAVNGDPTQPGALAVCNATQWETGTVGGGGACTLAADCVGTGSHCTAPRPDAGVTVVQEGGTCTVLPTNGQPCPDGACETSDSCCNGTTCVGFVPTGQTCQRGACTPQPCGSSDFCGWEDAGYVCQAKLPGGQPCGTNQAGGTLIDSCQTNQCVAGTCTAVQVTQYDICHANPDGI